MRIKVLLNENIKVAIVVMSVAMLSACSTLKIKPSDPSDVVLLPRPVETLGETIAREQQGEDGCLVAGNLNRGRDCEKLRELLLPPEASSHSKDD